MNTCLYFQIHQPCRIRPYNVFDIGNNHSYFDDNKNKEVMQKVAAKCYMPATKIVQSLLKKHPEFKVAYSITGTALEQMQQYSPETLALFEALSDDKRVEFLGETSHHSLASLFNEREFKDQIKQHSSLIKHHFGRTPTTFRNTELIYTNKIASIAKSLGFKAILAEGADKIIGSQSPNNVFSTPCKLPVLLKNYKLSDDIAFRFSDKQWNGHPLTPGKFASWTDAAGGQTTNLFMDYETFGEHQWKDSGIFTFLQKLPDALLKRNIGFHLPSEAAKLVAKGTLDVTEPYSWADVDRDVSAWTGNHLQNASLKTLYSLLPAARKSGHLETWRKLSTSDHFYYMCTKWFADGDVHKYFNPYDSPYDGFIAFMNVLKDFSEVIA